MLYCDTEFNAELYHIIKKFRNESVYTTSIVYSI